MNGRPKFKKWKRLTGRRIYWIKMVLNTITRIIIKIALTYGYAKMFSMLGIDGGIWIKILSWITSYWIVSKLFEHVTYMMIPVDMRSDISPMDLRNGFEFYNLMKDLEQLIFYTTDEDGT